jgi:FkbM family methyltransferase
LVEPQDHLKADIEDLTKAGIDIEWINAGAGNECGTQWFTITARDDSCSFLPRLPINGEKLNQVKMDVVTLNKIAANHSGQKPDLVKIDAEGWDLKVLEGASELIGFTDIFLMEAAICGQDIENNALSVIQKFDQLGYRIIDITDLNRSPKNQALWLVELVFLRRGSPLLNGTSYN